MGIIVVRDPNTGMPYTVRIAGDSPTDAEQANIDSFIGGRSSPPPPAPVRQEAPPEEGGGLKGLAKGFGRGLGVSLAEMPGGLAAFGESLMGYTPGSTAIGKHFLDNSRRGSERVRSFVGESDDSFAGKVGEVGGSLASFFMPAAAGAKVATALGAGARGASLAAGGAASVAGAGLGAQEQLARIEQRFAAGERVSDEEIRKAVRFGGAIGLSEGIPAEIIFSQAFRILRKVPAKAKDEAIRTITGKLKSAGVSALAEGGQELFSGIMQDLTEKGIYNPDLEVGQSAAEDFAAGGGAGAAITLLLDSIRGRQLNRFDRKKDQINEDLSTRASDAAGQVEYGRSALSQIADEENFQAQQEQIATEGPTRREEMARQREEAAGLNAAREAAFKAQQDARDAQRAAQDQEASRRAALLAQEKAQETQARIEGRKKEIVSRETLQRAELAKAKADAAARDAARTERERAEGEARIELAQKAIASRQEEERQAAEKILGKTEGIEQAVNDIRAAKAEASKAALQPPVATPEASVKLPVRLTKAQADIVKRALPTYAQGMTPKGDKVHMHITDPARVTNDVQNLLNSGDLKASEKGHIGALVNTLKQYESGDYKFSAPPTQQAKAEWQPKAQSEYVADPFGEEFVAKRDNVVNALRKELAGIIPDDRVDLVADNVLRPDLLQAETPTLVEGMESVGESGKRLISVATDIYDPKLSEEEYRKRLRGVMGHEIIHSMRSLGLFTDREWDALVGAAENTKYVVEKNGKRVTRDYSFMEREVARNDMAAEDVKIRDMDTLQEEAVADMFRAHLDGLLVNPKPEVRRLFGRILRFLKAVVRAGRASGFETRDRIFEQIKSGEIGQREPTGNRAGVRNSSFISGTYDTHNLQFHSELARQLWHAKQKYANPHDWKAIIKKMPGVKQSEIEWSGINEWLDEQAAKGNNKLYKDDVSRAVRVPMLIEHEKAFTTAEDDAAIASLPEHEDERLRHYDGKPRHADYTEAGGSNYREILITDPDLADHPINKGTGLFVRSGHFNEENIIVHARVKDRVSSDGQKTVLFVEEIQSDLGSELRKEGPRNLEVERYRVAARDIAQRIRTGREERNRFIDIISNEFGRKYDVWPDISYTRFAEWLRDAVEHEDYAREVVALKVGDRPKSSNSLDVHPFLYEFLLNDPEMMSTAQHAVAADDKLELADKESQDLYEDMPPDILRRIQVGKDSLPRMPWENNAYYELAAKRLLKEASGDRYDKIAWTPGYMQSERWGEAFGQRVKTVAWRPSSGDGIKLVNIKLADHTDGQFIALSVENTTGVVKEDGYLDGRAVGHHISELVGNELGKKIMGEDFGSVSGKDMTFGKAGFTNVYDSIIRKAFEKITKPYGVKAEIDRSLNFRSYSEMKAEAQEIIGKHYQDQNMLSFVRAHSLLLPETVDKILKSAEIRAKEDIEDYRNVINKYKVAVDNGSSALLPTERRAFDRAEKFVRDWGGGRLERNYQNATLYRHVRDGVPPYKIPGVKPAEKPVWSITMTPELRKALRSDTLPLYSAQPVADLNTRIDRQGDRLNYTHAYDKLAKALKLVPFTDGQKAADRAKWFITQFQDRMVPIGEIIDKLRSQGVHIIDAMDVYRKEMIYHGIIGARTAKAEKTLYDPTVTAIQAVKVPMNKWNDLKRVSEFARLAEDAYGSHALGSVEAYLYARHAKERNAYIATIDSGAATGSGMTDAEADAILKWYAGLAPDLKSQIGTAAARVEAIIANTNETRVDGGLTMDFNDPSYEGVKFDHYVPLRGVLMEENIETFMEDIVPGTGLARGRPLFGAVGREDRRMLGRQGQYARDLVANAMAQNTQAIQRAERNKVGQSLLNLVEGTDGALNGIVDVVLGPDGKPSIPMTRGMVNGKVRMVPDMKYRDERDRYVIVKRGGREIVLDVADHRVAQAMNGTLSPKAVNSVVRGMSRINRFLANINTSWNPEFMFSNFPRDIATALYNAGQYDETGLKKDIARNVIKAGRGIHDALRGDGRSEWALAYQEFIDAGGQNSLNTMEDLEGHIKKMEGRLRHIFDEDAQGRVGATKDALVDKGAWLLHTLEDYNTIAENASRLSLFKALRDRGVSKDRAAAAARDITTNFAKGGELKVALNSFYLFYNASLQGSMAIFNATARNPQKMVPMLAKIVLFGALMDQLNALFSEEDDDGRLIYDKINDYSLEHNIVIPDPFGISERNFFRIPIPYGLNMFFNTGRAMSRMARGEYESTDFINTMYGTALETVNPFGDSYNPFTGEGSALNMVSPTIADPFIQIARNEDYADRPIYKGQGQFGVKTPNSHLHWASTNPAIVSTTKFINEMTGGTSVVPGAIDWNPDKVEFWIEFLTGAAGQTVMRFAGLPFTTAEALGDGIQDDMMNNIPFARKLTIAVSEREDVGEYVEKRDKIMMGKKELEAALESGDRERVRAARQKYSRELSLEPRIRKLNNMRNGLRKKRAKIEENTRISDAQKKIMLDRIDAQLKELVTRANRLMKGL